MWRMWTHNISFANILISLSVLQKNVEPFLQFLHLIFMPHKVCGDKIIKIGVVFDFGLAHLYFTNIFTLKLLPYTKRF